MTQTTAPRIWFITGASKGLGRELAEAVLNAGGRFIATEPGPFRADFLGRSSTRARQILAEDNATAGKMRACVAIQDGKQMGDPVRAVRAMTTAVEPANPPARLLLGAAAYYRITMRLEQWAKDLNAREKTSLGADFRRQPQPRKTRCIRRPLPGKAPWSRRSLV